MNRGNTSPEKRGPESGRDDEAPQSGVDRYSIDPVAHDTAYRKAIALYHVYSVGRIPANRESFSEFLSSDQLSEGLTQAERLLLLEGISSMPGRTEKDNARVVRRAIKRLSEETREKIQGQGGPISQVRPSTTPPGAGSVDELELAEGSEADFDFDLSDQETARGDKPADPDHDKSAVA